MFEAIKKQMNLEEAMNKPQPLKHVYRAELLAKLQAAGIDGVKAALEEHEGGLERQYVAIKCVSSLSLSPS